MSRNKSFWISACAGLLMVGVLISGLFSASEGQTRAWSPWVPWAGVPRAWASGGTTLYLPLVEKYFPPPASTFGIQLSSINASGGLSQTLAAKAFWVGSLVSWSVVEPTMGSRNWSALASLESQWINAANNGLLPIVNVRSTPGWAQLYPGYYCGPMAQAYIGNFASFMHDLVARYSQPPYNIRYWEIWNEEDVDHTLPIDPAGSIGCWGNASDQYYGGGYYAQMLKVVYPQIKAADPLAQVLVGGLLLDCDPRGPCDAGASASLLPAWTENDSHVPSAVRNNPLPPMFFEGILANGGGPFFDGVSIHAYDVYGGSLGQYGNPYWNSAWNSTGPLAIAKAGFISSLLATYGIKGKFLLNTEMALMNGITNADFETTKAYYVTQGYAATVAKGLRASFWYSLYGWPERNTGLLDSVGNPLPAFNAYKFASSELDKTMPSRDIAEYVGVKGYELNRGDRRIWVVWSLDGSNHTTTLPGIPLAVWDALGNPITPAASLVIGLKPLYLEWNP